MNIIILILFDLIKLCDIYFKFYLWDKATIDIKAVRSVFLLIF